MKSHYNKHYYFWQKRLETFGAEIDLWKFEKLIKANDIILDFGCGAGSILKKLNCKKRYGIEISPYAVKDAEKKGITVFRKIQEIPSKLKFDAIISHHALEHTENPFAILVSLKNRLKRGGLMIWVVPIDDWRIQKKFQPEDIHKHLYAWNPQLLGNLFLHSGYKIKEVKILTHAWIPFSQIFFKILPKNIYYLLCRIWSIVTLNRQIRIVAVNG